MTCEGACLPGLNAHQSGCRIKVWRGRRRCCVLGVLRRNNTIHRQRHDPPHTQQRLLPLQTSIPQPLWSTLFTRIHAPWYVKATNHRSAPQRPYPLHLLNHVKRNGFGLRSQNRRRLHQRPRGRPDTHPAPQTRTPTACHSNPSGQLYRRRLY